jgi:hypothetical protein
MYPPTAAIALLLALLMGAPPAWAAADAVDEATARFLIEAVTAASDYDQFQARCRNDVSGRRSENLNKLLVNKFRLTLTGVQDKYFPERSYRLVQPRLQQEFLERLNGIGGCPGAKEQGLLEQLRTRYEALYDRLQSLP